MNALQLYEGRAVRRYRRRLLFRVVMSDPVFAVPAAFTLLQVLAYFL